MTELTSGVVVRYCKPSTLDEEKIPTSASFQLRIKEKYLSVYLLDYYKSLNEEESVFSVVAYMQKRYFYA